MNITAITNCSGFFYIISIVLYDFLQPVFAILAIMMYVSSAYLQAFLLSFACVFYAVAFLWSELRKRRLYAIDSLNTIQNNYLHIKKMDNSYKLLSVFFMIMIVCYVTLPSIYRFFIPIKILNNPLIDNIGLLILNISLVLIVVAQLDIDKEIYKIVTKSANKESENLLFYSKRKYIHGILVMCVGVVTVISTIVGSLVMILAFLLYRKDFHLQPGKR